MHPDGECACRAALSRMIKAQETLPDCESSTTPPGREALTRMDKALYSSRLSGFAGRLRGRLQEAAAQLMQMETQPGVAIGCWAADKAAIPRPKYRRHKASGRARRGLGRLRGESQSLTGGDDRSEGPRSGVVR